MLGKDFKMIRKNRTYTQIEVTNGITTQSTYSKFEAGIRNIDASIYIQLLHRLNISSEEFDYVRNNYSFGRKRDIIHSLFSMKYNHVDNLKILKQQAVDFLAGQYDKEIKQIYLICEAFIQLHDTKNIEVAQNIVKPIWGDMSKYEQWYLNDIRIINTILFLFPVEIAIDFTHTVLLRLNTYNDFQDAEKLKIAFKINLSLLLIKNKDYLNAYTIIVDSLKSDRKKMCYSILALHFSRKAICRFNIQGEGSREYLDKARKLLTLYDDQEYWKRVQQEYYHYTSTEFNNTNI